SPTTRWSAGAGPPARAALRYRPREPRSSQPCGCGPTPARRAPTSESRVVERDPETVRKSGPHEQHGAVEIARREQLSGLVAIETRVEPGDIVLRASPQVVEQPLGSTHVRRQTATLGFILEPLDRRRVLPVPVDGHLHRPDVREERVRDD